MAGEGYDKTVMSWHLDNLGQKYSWEKVIPESEIWKLRRVRWQKGSNNLILQRQSYDTESLWDEKWKHNYMT